MLGDHFLLDFLTIHVLSLGIHGTLDQVKWRVTHVPEKTKQYHINTQLLSNQKGAATVYIIMLHILPFRNHIKLKAVQLKAVPCILSFHHTTCQRY